ncbi:MAG: hypothetical protein HYY01_09030 [Chloroflexi bacterium]|nr:hypothetical protein [Chloroflexota bacterium]
MAVLLQLLSLCPQRDVALCVSDDARAEIERLAEVRPDVRDALLQQFGRFRQVAIRHSLGDASGSPLDPVVAEVEAFLLEKTQAGNRRKLERVKWDARHLAVAWDSGCDVFLTTDYGSLWAFRRGIRERLRLRVLRPVELWRELGGAEA